MYAVPERLRAHALLRTLYRVSFSARSSSVSTAPRIYEAGPRLLLTVSPKARDTACSVNVVPGAELRRSRSRADASDAARAFVSPPAVRFAGLFATTPPRAIRGAPGCGESVRGARLGEGGGTVEDVMAVMVAFTFTVGFEAPRRESACVLDCPGPAGCLETPLHVGEGSGDAFGIGRFRISKSPRSIRSKSSSGGGVPASRVFGTDERRGSEDSRACRSTPSVGWVFVSTGLRDAGMQSSVSTGPTL